MVQLLLITNMKSHMSFQLVPKSVTSNGLEQRNGFILCYFAELGSFYSPLHKSG